MAFLTRITDDTGQKVATLTSVRHCYLLPDGTQMWIPVIPAWCRGCGAFTMVERLEDPAKIEAAAHDFFRQRQSHPLLPLQTPEFAEAVNRNVLERSLHDAQQWRLALRDRRSPPRCLICGGIEYTTIPDDGGWCPHPADPARRVRAECFAHASTEGFGNLYDTEGRRIPGRLASR